MNAEAIAQPEDMFASPINTLRQVWLHAIKQACLAAIFSPLLILAFLPVLKSFDLMPHELDAPFVSLFVTAWLAGSAVTGVLAYGSGSTVYQLSKASKQIQRVHGTDTRSGLLNRRGFQEAMRDITGEATLAVLDIDRFKSINERYGHAVGDTVIERVGTAIVDGLGDARAVARLNGEEFAVIITSGDARERLTRLEELCRHIGETVFHLGQSSIRLTVSAGVAEMGGGREPDAAYRAADKALYLAKSAGRNRVLHERDLLQDDAADGMPLALQRGAA
ncbi:GGDEF domain-containing protein [Rhizobium sp. PAMB 3174]